MSRYKKRIMTVTFEVSEPQALSLQAMFEFWNKLGNQGSSRYVAFMVDGDGDFQPRCKMSYEGNVRPLTQEMRDKAIMENGKADYVFDYDPIGWILRKEDGYVDSALKTLTV